MHICILKFFYAQKAFATVTTLQTQLGKLFAPPRPVVGGVSCPSLRI